MENTVNKAVDNTQEILSADQPLNINSSDNENSSPEEKLILGKFKTIADLVCAYQNSEKLITQTREEIKKLRSESENGGSLQKEDGLTHEADDNSNLSDEQFLSRLKQLFESSDILEKKILNNEKLKNSLTEAIVKNTAESKPPQVMQGGGEIIKTPESKPKTFEEAGRAFINLLNKDL